MRTCNFAASGTYGHECGAPATLVGVKKSKLTHSGIYYAGRCEPCSRIKGGENSDIERFEKLDETTHVNDWNGRYQ